MTNRSLETEPLSYSNRMKFWILKYCLFILLSSSVLAQEDMIISHSRFMQKVNSSALGMNNINKTGVLYNSIGMNNSNRIESQYFFGAISFDNDNFSVGLDVYSLRMDNTGLVNTKPTFSYIYKIQCIASDQIMS